MLPALAQIAPRKVMIAIIRTPSAPDVTMTRSGRRIVRKGT